MSIKLIVTDMDGTLLNYEDEISQENTEALISAQKRGIQVILASGRSHRRLLPYAQKLHLSEYGGLLIEVNGMAIYDPKTQKRKIFEQLTKKEVLSICAYLTFFDVEIQVYFDDGFYCYIPDVLYSYKKEEREKRRLPDDYPWAGGAWSWVSDNRSGYPHQRIIQDFQMIDRDKLNKVNITHNADYLDQIEAKIKHDLKDYQVVRTCPRMLEITPKNITKGKTLKRYMDTIGLSKDEVMAFGDGENDVDMFKTAKISVAMENAEERIKKEASYVTSANTQSGVAKAIYQFVLHE